MAVSVSKGYVPPSNKSTSVAAVPSRTHIPRLSLVGATELTFYTELLKMIPKEAEAVLKAEFEAASTAIAKRLFNEGFTHLSYFGEFHHSIFTATKGSKAFKVKILFDRELARAKSCFDPNDLTRGEYCVRERLAAYPQFVKLHLDFGNDFYRACLFEHIEGITLWQQVKKAQYPQHLSPVLMSLRRYFQLIASMHAKRIAHRDPKLENAIVNVVDVYSIDHDFARYLPTSELSLSPRGSLACSAVERMKSCSGAAVGYSAFYEDRWSAGVMVVEACKQKFFPGVEKNINTAKEMIAYLEGQWKQEDQFKLEAEFQERGIPESVAKNLANLARALMHETPSKRMKVGVAANELGLIFMEHETQFFLEQETQLKLDDDASSYTSELPSVESPTDTSGMSDTSGITDSSSCTSELPPVESPTDTSGMSDTGGD